MAKFMLTQVGGWGVFGVGGWGVTGWVGGWVGEWFSGRELVLREPANHACTHPSTHPPTHPPTLPPTHPLHRARCWCWMSPPTTWTSLQRRRWRRPSARSRVGGWGGRGEECVCCGVCVEGRRRWWEEHSPPLPTSPPMPFSHPTPTCPPMPFPHPTPLRAHTGSVVAVSHDRYFLRRVATRVVTVENGKLVDYQGDYEASLTPSPRSPLPHRLAFFLALPIARALRSAPHSSQALAWRVARRCVGARRQQLPSPTPPRLGWAGAPCLTPPPPRPAPPPSPSPAALPGAERGGGWQDG